MKGWKYWTIQKQTIVDFVLQGNTYYPDFSESMKTGAFAEDRDDDILLNPLYERILYAFNNINNSNFPGLVFSFLSIDGTTISSFHNYEEFYNQIQSPQTQRYIYSMWKHLMEQDSVILELEYPEYFNEIRIGFNNFQYLMPPVIYMPPFTKEAENMLYQSIDLGHPMEELKPSGLMQAHLPYIKKENIENVYNMFELED